MIAFQPPVTAPNTAMLAASAGMPSYNTPSTYQRKSSRSGRSYVESAAPSAGKEEGAVSTVFLKCRGIVIMPTTNRTRSATMRTAIKILFHPGTAVVFTSITETPFLTSPPNRKTKIRRYVEIPLVQ